VAVAIWNPAFEPQLLTRADFGSVAGLIFAQIYKDLFICGLNI